MSDREQKLRELIARIRNDELYSNQVGDELEALLALAAELATTPNELTVEQFERFSFQANSHAQSVQGYIEEMVRLITARPAANLAEHNPNDYCAHGLPKDSRLCVHCEAQREAEIRERVLEKCLDIAKSMVSLIDITEAIRALKSAPQGEQQAGGKKVGA